MRVAAISDTHDRQSWEIPNCDVFIHAGDMSDEDLCRLRICQRRLRNGLV